MNIRTVTLAGLLAVGLLTTAACSKAPGQAALPLPSGAPATVTVTAAPASPSAVSPESTSPTSTDGSASGRSGDTTSTTDETSPATETTDTTDTTETTQTDTSAAVSSVADATTTAWVSGICTGMGSVLQELVEKKPQVDATASLATLRQAMMDYYALSSKTASTAYDDTDKLDPPNVTDGPKIHQAYQHFLRGLIDIFYNATLDMSGATDLATIKSINAGVDQQITTLGTDNVALQAMDAAPLADIAKTLPACQKVKQLAS